MCVCVYVCVCVVWLCFVFYLKNLYVTFYKINSVFKKKKKKKKKSGQYGDYLEHI